jgi:serine/threonine-protein kinase
MSRGAPQILGRYALHDEFARGGMAQLHYGTVLGDAAFQKTVAIKRLLPQLKADAEIVTMLIDEARMASRVSHPNVVSILDVIAEAGEVALVMPYVDAESLARLVAAARASGAGCPVPIASRIVHDVLLGLHAAHEAKDAAGQPLGLVHRDVSPENVLVGADGVARVADFGVAKARGKLVVTREGAKVTYAIDGDAAKECTRGVSENARVYVGLRGASGAGTSGARNLFVRRE